MTDAKSKELKIEHVSVEDLIPYAKNARTHSDTQVAQIAASMTEFGFVNPILLGHDNVIIAGHGRLMAAKLLGMKNVPTIRLKQIRHDYKMEFVEDCSINFTFDQIVMKIMEKYHSETQKPINPNIHLPRHIHPIDFNCDALKNTSRGTITKLIPGTVLEREYHGEVYVVYCRQGYYEYSRRKYRTLTTIAGEISGTYCSGPNFFSVKTRMYMLPSKDLHPEKMEFVPDK
jgi:hypothetical protein